MNFSNPFWTFSLNLYAQDRVKSACLTLQDTYSLNVNLLLYCCWTGLSGQQLNAKRFFSIATCAKDWQREVLTPLRQIRANLKHREYFAPQCPTTQHANQRLCRAVCAQEIAAEKILQDELFERGEEWLVEAHEQAGSPENLVWRNLRCYLENEGCMIADYQNNPELQAIVQATLLSVSAAMGESGGDLRAHF